MECRIDEATRVGRAEEAGIDLILRSRERWYVAQTLHHREKLAQLHLQAQGFRSFFPRFRRTARHARKLREVVAPIFAGYVFIILDAERDRWRSINGTLGVARAAHRRSSRRRRSPSWRDRQLGPCRFGPRPEPRAVRAGYCRSVCGWARRAGAPRQQVACSRVAEHHGRPSAAHH